MATIEDINRLIGDIPRKVREQVPTIIATEAVGYYKERFRKKDWDGQPWKPAKNPPPRGSLMIRSSQLVNSIHPSRITPSEVVISNEKPYARIHNEGGTVTQIPTPKQRRFFWALEHKTNPGAWNGGGKLDLSKTKEWGWAARAKKLTINIPRRKFMGHSPILFDRILDKIHALLNLK